MAPRRQNRAAGSQVVDEPCLVDGFVADVGIHAHATRAVDHYWAPERLQGNVHVPSIEVRAVVEVDKEVVALRGLCAKYPLPQDGWHSADAHPARWRVVEARDHHAVCAPDQQPVNIDGQVEPVSQRHPWPAKGDDAEVVEANRRHPDSGRGLQDERFRVGHYDVRTELGESRL